ncbi:DNA-binding response regulator [Candidatus Cerribacteria bacterium 'Amazon FNV 2010 28 9']|uniref:DNA-binding response regulator n=1 Tax=Candidatus Cerribacteria bacterium 'Amazon FNV 2010 28 9' TaxID=2081795 RepID=A0A317JNC9_9BACT|nr:MAG: DNA-binding response regulator [Candidatus Cerribacteria bacterium 'Amazon FNV 2010 28 9']
MRILVIEDEQKIANSIKKGLEQEHFVVDVAYDGEAGFDLASTGSYDVLVLDRLLPGKDGINITRELRQNNIHTPILMLTALGEIEDKVRGLDTGADDYLSKPFAFAELIARLHSLTRRPPVITEQIITVDSLTINLTTHDIRRADASVNCTKKEYMLLEYLARNTNRTISKDEIIEHVWPFEADILPNTVEVYIGYLRKKIDVAFPNEPPLIHTVRGFGYRFGK